MTDSVHKKLSMSRLKRLDFPVFENARRMQTGRVHFDDESCTRCGTCASICPGRAIAFDDDLDKEAAESLPALIEDYPDITYCISCGCCIAACGQDSISIVHGFRAGGHFEKLHQKDEFTPPQKY